MTPPQLPPVWVSDLRQRSASETITGEMMAPKYDFIFPRHPLQHKNNSLFSKYFTKLVSQFRQLVSTVQEQFVGWQQHFYNEKNMKIFYTDF